MLVFGIIIGALNYRSTERFRRMTGVSPWRISPIIWAVGSVFVSLIVTILAFIAMRTTRVPGNNGSFTATRTVRRGVGPFGHGPGGLDGTSHRTGPGSGTGSAGGRSGIAPTLPAPGTTMPVDARWPSGTTAPGGTPATAPPGWHPDPSAKFEYRYWDGSAWTEHVSSQGIADVDPVVSHPSR